MVKVLKLIGILSMILMPLMATAQTSPTVDEKVRYILEVTEAQKNFDLGFNSVKPLMLKQIQATSKKVTPELASYILQIFDDELNSAKPSIMSFMNEYFKRSFNEEEIGALYDFYKTPIGSRLASKTNSVMAGAMAEIQVFAQREVLPRLTERLSRDVKLREALKP
jgi:hypothetical protein